MSPTHEEGFVMPQSAVVQCVNVPIMYIHTLLMFAMNNVASFATINNTVTVTQCAHCYLLRIDSEKWSQFHCFLKI